MTEQITIRSMYQAQGYDGCHVIIPDTIHYWVVQEPEGGITEEWKANVRQAVNDFIVRVYAHEPEEVTLQWNPNRDNVEEEILHVACACKGS